jgi:ATP-dependent protease ClpP protease subunit
LPEERLWTLGAADINPNTTESLSSVMSEAANQRTKAVYLALSTPEGPVREGMNLYSVLRGMPFDLTIHNVGSVDSIGYAIFLAGKNRFAVANSTFMFHGVGFNITGPTRFEEQSTQDHLDSILADQKRIGGVISERSKLNSREVTSLFRRQKTKDVKWAIDKGIIHEIRDLQIPPGSSAVSLVFWR